MLLSCALPIASAANAEDVPFEGPYAGIFVGALEHHVFLETTDTLTGARDGRYYRDWQIGGGVMAGYDITAGERLRIGGEGSLQIGGGSPGAYFNGVPYQQNERFGYRLTAKAGVVPTDRMLIFVKGGYGGDRFAIDNSAEVEGVTQWRNSFVVGAGAQVRFGSLMELRIEYEHLDNSSHAFFIGVPIRF